MPPLPLRSPLHLRGRRCWGFVFRLVVRAAFDGADHADRGADGDDAGRDVAQDERAGADHAAVADGDAREDRHAGADPDVLADADGAVVLQSLRAERPFRADDEQEP